MARKKERDNMLDYNSSRLHRVTDDGPWIVNEEGREIICLSTHATDDDADYIVQACNEFPNMLEALRALSTSEKTPGMEGIPPHCGPLNACPACTAARAILARLT